MKRRIWIGLGIALLLLLGVGVWGFGYVRQVDGRSPAQWLAYADQASKQCAYYAEGQSMTNGTSTRFVLEQGTGGRYVMTTKDAQGQPCSLGYDGSQMWYSAGAKQGKITVAQNSATPLPGRAYIVGTATAAGRSVVMLTVGNGNSQKKLSIDRKTGVVLAMTTRVQRQIQSEMEVDRVDYRAVTVTPCDMDCATAAKVVDRATLTASLGGNIVEAKWLPKGYVLTDMLLGPCGECGLPMGVLRYSDGISAITLFEMSRHAPMCDTGEGCRQTANEHALVMSKTVGEIEVTALGTVDTKTFNKVVAHLR